MLKMIVFENKSQSFFEKCSVVWFPDAVHTALEVDNTLYNPFWKNVESENLDTIQRTRAIQGKSEPYYQFHIGLKKGEKELLLQEWKQLGLRTCSANTAKLLSKVTGLQFPWIKTWTPANFADALYEMKDSPRILSIEYLGTNTAPNITSEIAQKKQRGPDSIEASFQFLLLLLFVLCLIQALLN